MDKVRSIHTTRKAIGLYLKPYICRFGPNEREPTGGIAGRSPRMSCEIENDSKTTTARQRNTWRVDATHCDAGWTH